MRIKELSEEENNLIDELLTLRRKKETRNRLKQNYYNKKIPPRNLGISIPPSMSRMSKPVSGWGAKAVDDLAVRSRFDGFTYKGLEEDPLLSVLRANNFRNLYKQATTSELINSCAFCTIGAGAEDEPAVVFNFYSAIQAAAKWDSRKKRISAGIVVTKWGANVKGLKTGLSDVMGFILYTDDSVIECEKNLTGWEVNRMEHDYGRPLMEALIYNPTLMKPFGKSRIGRSVMSIIDRTMRTAVRMDIAAEFFTAPQKYLLGVDKDVLDGATKWDTYIDSIFGASRDEDGNIPEFGQLPQGQLTPLTEQLHSLAAEFSGETSIPMSSLGVIFDNPASAEGIYATKEDLIMKAEDLNELNGEALRNIGLIAHMIMNNVSSIDELSEEIQSITPKFKNPAKPSTVSQSDAMIKQVTAMPWIAETDVALEELGYSESQILRMKSQKTAANATDVFLEIAGQVNEENPDG